MKKICALILVGLLGLSVISCSSTPETKKQEDTGPDYDKLKKDAREAADKAFKELKEDTSQ